MTRPTSGKGLIGAGGEVARDGGDSQLFWHYQLRDETPNVSPREWQPLDIRRGA